MRVCSRPICQEPGESKKMPPILGLFNVIQQKAIEWTKRLFKSETLTITDTTFTITSKYSAGLLAMMVSLSCANQFFRDIDISCKGTVSPFNLDDFCWNQETYIVERGLWPANRGDVSYPGVIVQSTVDRKTDVEINQRYYKFVWLGLSVCMLFAYAPRILWKASV
jgi:Innexin